MTKSSLRERFARLGPVRDVDRSRSGSPVEFVLPPEGVKLDDVERQLLVQALERANGNQTHAAQLLGINRDQVRYRIEKFSLERPAPTAPARAFASPPVEAATPA